jgi:hypothetical protein
MGRGIITLLAAIVSSFCFTSNTSGDVVVSIVPDSTTIVEGSPTLDFALRFEGVGTHIGASFDAFDYAIAVTNSGSSSVPLLKPITTSDLTPNLSSIFVNINDQSASGAPNQLAGQVSVGSNSGDFAVLPTDVLRLTADTSQLKAGDEITINPNLFEVAAVSFQGEAYPLAFNSGTVSVTAIPEPISAWLLCLASSFIFVRRSRRHGESSALSRRWI